MPSKTKDTYFEKALDWVEKKAAEEIKANCEGYERPQIFVSKSSEKEISPDISFVGKDGSKSYTDIALKVDNKRGLVTRWKLLSLMANMKNGDLFLLTPRGHKMFTKRLVDKYDIEAKIESI